MLFIQFLEKPHWDFEFLMSNKAFNGTDADKITKRDDPGRLSNSPEQNTSQSLKSISPLSARMSSINGIKSANRPSTSRSNSSMLASSPLSQRGSRAFTEVYNMKSNEIILGIDNSC